MGSHSVLFCILCLTAFSAAGWRFHRSFRNGYPEKLNVSKEEAHDSFTISGGSAKYSPGMRGGESTVSITFSDARPKVIEGKVTRVSDGDTIWVQDAKLGKCKINLNNIDAPESSQPYGNLSTLYLKSLIGDRNVRVEYKTKDRYGCYLGTVYLDDQNINLEMVRSGNAWVYFYSDDAVYHAAQKQAKAARKGLWVDENPEDPHSYRRRQRGLPPVTREHNDRTGSAGTSRARGG